MKTAAVTPRQENFNDWFQDVIKVADLAEHSATRGCMVIKPWGYGIWELIQKNLDQMIKDTGHKNVYFPLLIPIRFLEKEAQHVEGFAKECAVVTHYRLETDANGKLVPSPDAALAEPYIIRPTSETIIGEAMSSWVNSYTDLPILINQWCNVMRWEMRTRLFLRTAEFLWQEGHTAHATSDEAMTETLQMLEVYKKFAYEYLAIPVMTGEKTPAERFPGADHTYTIEAMMQDGKALQAGTSHFLGQHFSKAYNIKFNTKEQSIEHAWTTSWGVTTRLIGALVMVHSDDDGLVLPPRMAPDQIVILPLIKNEEDRAHILEYCTNLKADLKKQTAFEDEKLRVEIDASGKKSPDKFWGAVKRGVPLRLEIGMKDIEAGHICMSRRDMGAKERTFMKREELIEKASSILEEMQAGLLERAITFRDAHIFDIHTVADLENMFAKDDNVSKGFARAYFDIDMENNPDVADKLKTLKVTTRCLPTGQQNTKGACIFSGKETTHRVLLAKAY